MTGTLRDRRGRHGALGALGARGGVVAVGCLAWAVALIVAYHRAQVSYGQDLQPVYEAGLAIRAGQPIYRVAHFVYPPFAAVVGVPLTLLSRHAAGQLDAVVQVALPLAAAGVLGFALDRGRREVGFLLGGVLAAGLMGAYPFSSALFLENLSLLFLPALVAIGLCWGTGRWTAGTVVLAVSIAIKPLLVLLVLVPLVRRQWRACVIGLGVGLVLTAIGAALSSDLHGLLHLPGIILHGTNLHGAYQANNDSLTSIGIVHPAFRWPLAAARLVLAAGVAVTLWGSRHGPLPVERALVLGGLLAIALPVCGAISEGHYANLALPAAAVVVLGRWGRAARVLAVVGLAVLAIPLHHHGHSTVHTREIGQLHDGLGQAVLLLAFLLARPARRGADRQLVAGLEPPAIS